MTRIMIIGIGLVWVIGIGLAIGKSLAARRIYQARWRARERDHVRHRF